MRSATGSSLAILSVNPSRTERRLRALRKVLLAALGDKAFPGVRIEERHLTAAAEESTLRGGLTVLARAMGSSDEAITQRLATEDRPTIGQRVRRALRRVGTWFAGLLR